MILHTLVEFIGNTGFLNMDIRSAIMIIVALIFLVLEIRYGFEPPLLVPISFGMLLSNLPLSGMFDEGGLFIGSTV